ncbi:hypothetical protein K438DRAFT_1774126 [Mycena galopus ATCC 62051]|nr:hypothetical protein K438DRAFT_1774126 [Mycena galopus ATCC 62051]
MACCHYGLMGPDGAKTQDPEGKKIIKSESEVSNPSPLSGFRDLDKSVEYALHVHALWGCGAIQTLSMPLGGVEAPLLLYNWQIPMHSGKVTTLINKRSFGVRGIQRWVVAIGNAPWGLSTEVNSLHSTVEVDRSPGNPNTVGRIRISGSLWKATGRRNSPGRPPWSATAWRYLFGWHRRLACKSLLWASHETQWKGNQVKLNQGIIAKLTHGFTNLTRHYTIGTTFPNRTLDDNAATIKQAGLASGVVAQRTAVMKLEGQFAVGVQANEHFKVILRRSDLEPEVGSQEKTGREGEERERKEKNPATGIDGRDREGKADEMNGERDIADSVRQIHASHDASPIRQPDLHVVGCVWSTSKLTGALAVAADAAAVLDDVEKAAGTGAPRLFPDPEKGLDSGGKIEGAHDLDSEAVPPEREAADREVVWNEREGHTPSTSSLSPGTNTLEVPSLPSVCPPPVKNWAWTAPDRRDSLLDMPLRVHSEEELKSGNPERHDQGSGQSTLPTREPSLLLVVLVVVVAARDEIIARWKGRRASPIQAEHQISTATGDARRLVQLLETFNVGHLGSKKKAR